MSRISRVRAEPDVTPAEDLLRMMVSTISQPSTRSYQVKIGPSGLGDPCDHCVAEVMAQQLHPEDSTPSQGSLATWLGTAFHYYLEHQFTGPEWDEIGFMPERSGLYIGTIPGYGKITGTADAYSQFHETVVDYKGTSKGKIQYYKMHGMPQAYRFQRHMYGKGLELKGFPVKYVANLFIPRDGFRFSDIWWQVEPYDPTLADRALKRATMIFKEYVKTGRIDELGSDEDCFQCNSFNAPAKVRVRRRNNAQ